MANKMADKKKNTNRPASQAATRTTPKPKEKDAPVKSISAMARDEVKKAQEQENFYSASSLKSSSMVRDEHKCGREQTKFDSTSSVKSISAMARDERKGVKEQEKLESKPVTKASTATLRNEPKKDRTVQDTKVRRTSKEPQWLTRFRNSRIGRFVFEAYYELRHKVTWPTFEEARNMTIIVIVLSAIIGGAIALLDYGLYYLFILISGGK